MLQNNPFVAPDPECVNVHNHGITVDFGGDSQKFNDSDNGISELGWFSKTQYFKEKLDKSANFHNTKNENIHNSKFGEEKDDQAYDWIETQIEVNF